jgi:hypothetical protein
MPTPPAHPMNDGLSLYPQAGAVSLTLGGGELGHGLIGTDKDQKGWLWWQVHIALPGGVSTWIPPRFSSSYLSFCWLAAAAGTAEVAGIKFHHFGLDFPHTLGPFHIPGPQWRPTGRRANTTQ